MPTSIWQASAKQFIRRVFFSQASLTDVPLPDYGSQIDFSRYLYHRCRASAHTKWCLPFSNSPRMVWCSRSFRRANGHKRHFATEWCFQAFEYQILMPRKWWYISSRRYLSRDNSRKCRFTGFVSWCPTIHYSLSYTLSCMKTAGHQVRIVYRWFQF